jgi:hypothetical protein
VVAHPSGMFGRFSRFSEGTVFGSGEIKQMKVEKEES